MLLRTAPAENSGIIKWTNPSGPPAAMMTIVFPQNMLATRLNCKHKHHMILYQLLKLYSA
jgi:hypothetical protein